MSVDKKRFRLIAALLVFLAVIVAAVAITFVPSDQDNQVVRVGFMKISPALPYFVAEQRGLFEEHDVRIEPVLYTSGLQMLDDLVNQDIDASITGPVDVLFAREIESPDRFRIYLHAVYSPESPIYSLVVKKESPIQSTADLKGKKVAVAPGVTNGTLLALMLERRHGFKRGTDFDAIGVGFGQQLDALRAGEYDALVPLEARGTIAHTSPDLRVVEWGLIEKEVMNPLPITVFALSSTAVESKPDEVRKFVSAIEDAVSLIRDDEASMRRLLIESIDLTAEQAQKCGTGRYVMVKERDEANLQGLADLLTEHEILSAKIDVERLYHEP